MLYLELLQISLPNFADGSFRDHLWEIFARLFYVVYVIGLVQLIPQMGALIGDKGITPIKPRLAAYKRDFPNGRFFFYLPTYLWISADEWFMGVLLWIGTASALYNVIFGINTLASFLCWSIYMSFMAPAAAMWPWDILLNEAGFLALFLSPHSPHPMVAFGYRWLMFRLMFGFGKLKFQGSTKNDFLYIKDFFTAQPIPSRSGFYLQKLPSFVHKLSLAFFFLAEIPTPFTFLYPLAWPWGSEIRLLGAITTLLLQVGIFISGNFGFFNILTAVLCIPLLDLYNVAPNLGEMVHPLLFLLPLSVIVLLFNTWMNLSWYFWPTLRMFDPIRKFYRFLQPFTIVNSYGVFPPHSVPKERFVPIIEGSHDGTTWQEYEYKYLTTLPWFLSPYHPRFEYTFFYTFMGAYDNLYCSLTAVDPYHLSKFPLHHRIAQRLLEGAPAVRRIFRNDPFPNQPPKFVRINVYMHEPQATGPFYKRTYMHVHLPPMQSNPQLWEEWIVDPMMWHFDLVVWRDRYTRIWGPRKISEAATKELHDFISSSRFEKNACLEEGWSAYVRRQAEGFQKRYSPAQKRVLEKQLGNLTWILMRKLDPLLPTLASKTGCKNYSYLGLLAHIIIAKGENTVKECLKPGNEHIIEKIAKEEFTLEQGMYLFTLFWYSVVTFQARKFRLMDIIVVRDESPSAAKFIPGFLSKDFLKWLSQQFLPVLGEEEFLPVYSYDVGGWNLLGRRKLTSLEDVHIAHAKIYQKPSLMLPQKCD